MVTELERSVQRPDIPHNYAIVDEVDSILIDEARTPLIISGPAEETEEVYRTFARIVPRLQPDRDFVIDLKHKSVTLTDDGVDAVEKGLGIKNLYDPQNFRLTRFMDAALKANFLYHRDQQYVVKDGEIVIVDEFTGRMMYGRRWSDGLHQAVEAKEGVRIQRESVTYATITLQNYFRLYKKLAGMTGTAWTERDEFHQIYGLDVLVAPTHREMVRRDMSDIIYRTLDGKFKAVADEIEDAHADGRPVLVGTIAIETSEMLSDLLKRRSTCRLEDCDEYHQVCPLKEPSVLNAKQHEREAQIVAQAGVLGAVTIATNMAGRGTDIILGGSPDVIAEAIARKQKVDLVTAPEEVAAKIRQEAREKWQSDHDDVVEAGGLHIVGTERHESRRIDNQLRGRSGRQGDPGSSRFFVSFGDDLMRRFAPEWVPNLLAKMGMDDDTPLESGMVSKSIEQAQTKVEGHNFDIRKHVVQYDDVMNQHRDVIYKQRRQILSHADLKENVLEMVEQEIGRAFDAFGEGDPEDWDADGLQAEIKAVLPLPPSFTPKHLRELGDDCFERVIGLAHELYEKKGGELGEERMRTLERLVLLRVIDRLWVYHLTALEELRQGIGLQGYAQRDPLVEFKREAFDMFSQLTEHIRQNMARQIYHVTLTTPAAARQEPPQNLSESGPAETEGSGGGTATATATRTEAAAAGAGAAATPGGNGAPAAHGKVGRNDPCPCGSGKKYKKCHGAGGIAGVG
jgi:preprotein translocase subunit SecA